VNDTVIGIALVGGAAWLVWMLVSGFRTGSMDALRSISLAERNGQPFMFWLNTTLNVFYLVVIAIILRHMIQTGGL
jgi:uncharacterized membrane protein